MLQHALLMPPLRTAANLVRTEHDISATATRETKKRFRMMRAGGAELHEGRLEHARRAREFEVAHRSLWFPHDAPTASALAFANATLGRSDGNLSKKGQLSSR